MGKAWTNKFIVIKWEDVRNYLTAEQLDHLHIILKSIRHGRKQEGKTASQSHLVINTDEAYANEVIDIMKRHGHWSDTQ